MLSIEFILPIATFSVNNMFYGNRHILKDDYRDWMSEVFHYLAKPEYQELFQQFRDAYSPKDHVCKVDYTALYPKSEFFTKKGLMNAKIHDLTNWEKPLQDLLFNASHAARAYPHGVQNLMQDDKIIFEMTSRKVPADVLKRCIRVRIELLPFSSLDMSA